MWRITTLPTSFPRCLRRLVPTLQLGTAQSGTLASTRASVRLGQSRRLVPLLQRRSRSPKVPGRLARACSSLGRFLLAHTLPTVLLALRRSAVVLANSSRVVLQVGSTQLLPCAHRGTAASTGASAFCQTWIMLDHTAHRRFASPTEARERASSSHVCVIGSSQVSSASRPAGGVCG